MNTTQCPECLSTNVDASDPGYAVDCLACGVWWDREDPRSQPDHPLFGKPLLDGPPAPFCCGVCEEPYDPDYPMRVIARWQDDWYCTDCLENRPGKEEAEAEAETREEVAHAQHEYRENGGGYCVYCASARFTIRRATGEGSSLYQECRCDDCQRPFTLVYRLGGYLRDDLPLHTEHDLDAIQDVIAVDMAEEEV